MTHAIETIRQNVQELRQRMAEAAGRSGRPADAVRLVAVTKYVDAELTAAVVAAGCRDLGESRPQQLWEKAVVVPDGAVDWHLIGHLQRNKVRRTLPLVAWVHSVDSWRLLETLEQEASAQRLRPRVLLEVNVSAEEAKHGLIEQQLLDEGPAQLAQLQWLQVCGLMGMSGWGVEADTARRQFALLRALRDRLQQRVSGLVRLDELSMGMSGDFELAIEEGATWVRVGSTLFQGIPEADRGA
jgi:PLP dependent protein